MLNMIADNLESIVQIYKYISDKMNVDVRSWKYILSFDKWRNSNKNTRNTIKYYILLCPVSFC